MSDPKRSLEFQIGCLRDVFPSARNEDIRGGIEAAIKTLEWLSKGDVALKEFIRLRREDPELFDLLCQIIGAGAKLGAIRERNAA